MTDFEAVLAHTAERIGNLYAARDSRLFSARRVEEVMEKLRVWFAQEAFAAGVDPVAAWETIA